MLELSCWLCDDVLLTSVRSCRFGSSVSVTSAGVELCDRGDTSSQFYQCETLKVSGSFCSLCAGDFLCESLVGVLQLCVAV